MWRRRSLVLGYQARLRHGRGRARVVCTGGVRSSASAVDPELPPGNHVLYTRPVTSIGTPVTGFTPAAHNRVAFTVR
jgi:hypothetical protein